MAHDVCRHFHRLCRRFQSDCSAWTHPWMIQAQTWPVLKVQLRQCRIKKVYMTYSKSKAFEINWLLTYCLSLINCHGNCFLFSIDWAVNVYIVWVRSLVHWLIAKNLPLIWTHEPIKFSRSSLSNLPDSLYFASVLSRTLEAYTLFIPSSLVTAMLLLWRVILSLSAV